jgi:DNA segregation ATPase ftsK/spoIIIE and related proteins
MTTDFKIKVLWHFIKSGMRRIRSDRQTRTRAIVVAVVFALMFLLTMLSVPDGALAAFERGLYGIAFAIFGVLLVTLGTAAAGLPRGFLSIAQDIQRIGLKNAAGEYPVLIDRHKEDDTVEVLTFLNHGVYLAQFEDYREKLESALDINIVSVEQGTNNRTVRLRAVPASGALPAMLPWANRYLNNEDFVLVLGRGLAGLVTVNLATTPHILLGGSTGSGKSVLLKLLVMESIKKGAVVCVADFKGGVDYPAVWHEYCRFCFTLEELVPLLDELLAILEERKRLFKNVGCANLGEYNAATNEDLPRYIFACDEVAEVLDKTGLNKEQKEQVAQVESRLATIARQGRAFGIHLILATQRPDANILAGQIKNNIDCRICGRADNVLSQIILDSTDAADRIPKTSRGRFLLHDGTVFQAFLFDDKTI